MTIRLTPAEAARLTGKARTKGKAKVAVMPLAGSPHMQVRLSLPWPPTVNHYYTVAHGRKVLSKAGKAYREAVAMACLGEGHVTGRISVNVWAYPSSRRRFDLDNLLKGLFDSIQAAGVFRDDSDIDHITVHRCEVKEAAYLSVELVGEWPG